MIVPTVPRGNADTPLRGDRATMQARLAIFPALPANPANRHCRFRCRAMFVSGVHRRAVRPTLPRGTVGAINPPQCDFRRVPMSAANCTFRVKFWRVAPAFRRVPMGIVQRSAIAPIKPWLVGCKHLPPQLLHKADARSAQFALRIGSLALSGASGRQAHRAFARKESCADRPSKNGGL